ncbi:MAG: alkaline phosphatase family protein, partial [Planctomycetales bacterium]|nr:alkaline phosphatase family protein [Planctomycetales bacterium]
MFQPLLVINIAGLGHDAIGAATPKLAALTNQGRLVAVEPSVPALTSTSQATIFTGTLPAQHGAVANGWYFRDLALILNWQRSANLVHGETLWEAAKAADPKTKSANLFWRYATHSTCDFKITERPTYWADGRKGPDVYAEPPTIRSELFEKFGPFPLFRFWGPVADITSTRWIADATIHVLQKQEFQLVLTYLPHLDYDHQRFGPDSPEGTAALQAVDAEAGRIIDIASEEGMRVAVVSDYGFEHVSRPVFVNRALREAGYISVQDAANGELLEPGASRAFAVCDQQVAHVYVNDKSAYAQIEKMLASVDGVDRVFNRERMKEMGLDHNRSGEFLLVAGQDCWFAYPYWLDESKAPDFARCVAIHDKPGFDPTELFMRPGLSGTLHLAKRFAQKTIGQRAPFDVISGDPSVVGGSHGRIPIDNQTRPVLLTNWDR